jgi:hypothetical protein
MHALVGSSPARALAGGQILTCMPAGDSKNEPHREKKPSFFFQCGRPITRKQDIKHINVGVDVEEVYLVKSRVMFLGYYMFLLSRTIKEEILHTHLDRANLIPDKYQYRKNDWNHRDTLQ